MSTPEQISIEAMINDPKMDRTAILARVALGDAVLTTNQLNLIEIKELCVKNGAAEENIRLSMNFDSHASN